MHSNRDVAASVDVILAPDFELGDDSDPVVTDFEPNGVRRSWRQTCAAKRNIERMREEQHLRKLLADTFDDDAEYDPADLDSD